ncbi:hypothetical protein [Breoghania sp.]|uniref:hypothetical protein n=1 Tax=Breoghania sp. TaxID=2065378 RepID=UPI0029C9F5AD|nr:hypothetical protein [Breoghania sp.]
MRRLLLLVLKSRRSLLVGADGHQHQIRSSRAGIGGNAQCEGEGWAGGKYDPLDLVRLPDDSRTVGIVKAGDVVDDVGSEIA